eukprot:ctg_748.g266
MPLLPRHCADQFNPAGNWVWLHCPHQAIQWCGNRRSASSPGRRCVATCPTSRPLDSVDGGAAVRAEVGKAVENRRTRTECRKETNAHRERQETAIAASSCGRCGVWAVGQGTDVASARSRGTSAADGWVRTYAVWGAHCVTRSGGAGVVRQTNCRCARVPEDSDRQGDRVGYRAERQHPAHQREGGGEGGYSATAAATDLWRKAAGGRPIRERIQHRGRLGAASGTGAAGRSAPTTTVWTAAEAKHFNGKRR